MKDYTKILTFLFSILFLGTSSNAQVYVDQAATGTNDGSSWANAYTDLATPLGIIAGGQIWVAQGTYKPGSGTPDSSSSFLISSSISVYGGFDGTESTLADRDPMVNQTILSGDINGDDIEDDFTTNRSDNVQHVVVVDSLLFGATIDGFYIRNGHTSESMGAPFPNWAGAGVLSFSLTIIRNCSFTQNFAQSGAGAYITAGPGNIDDTEITDCSFANNSVTNQAPGLFLNGADGALVQNCEFVDNVSNRGAFYPRYCNDVTINNCSFRGNVAVDENVFGVAMFVWQSTNVSITNSEFVENTGNNAPCIYLDARELTDLVNFSVSDCNFEKNVGGTDAFGGCFYNWQGRGVTFRNTSFVENIIGNGPGIYSDNRNVDSEEDDLLIENCSFRNNNAIGFGGGALRINQGSVTFDNNTCVDNTSENGSHLFFFGEDRIVNIKNSSFSGGDSNFGGVAALYGGGSKYNLSNNEFFNNNASTSGGALIIGFQAETEINDCKFTNNSSQTGGAIRVQNDSTVVDIINSTFETNTATNLGGGIYQGGGSTLSIDKSNFFVNSAAEGGALSLITFNDDIAQGTATISNTIFNFNSAENVGGGIEIIDMPTNLTNVLINNNSVTGDQSFGGGIYFEVSDSNSAILSIVNATIANNLANSGAGMYFFRSAVETEMSVSLQNTLSYNVGENFGMEGDPIINSETGNLSGDDSGVAFLTGGTDLNSAADALFLDPTNADYHITTGSPAIDIGNPFGAPLLDIDGNPRFGEYDSGAYEYDKSVGLNLIFDNSALEILPNPVSEFLYCTLTEKYMGELEFHIFTTKGKRLRSWSETKSSEAHLSQFNVSELASSSYVLFVKFGNRVVSQQFLKL